MKMLTKLTGIVLLLVTSSCGKTLQTPRVVTGAAGTSCSVADTTGGSSITCGDVTTFVSNGTNGVAGTNGHTALIYTSTFTSICGTAGGYSVFLGTDLNDDGVLQNSEITSTAQLCNGAQGQAPQFTPVAVIEPCGHSSSAYKEALLGLQGGAVYGSFSANSSALTVRNTLIPDGSYYDTDDSECNFSVSTDSSGNRTVTWDGSSQTGTLYPAGSATYTACTQTWTQN